MLPLIQANTQVLQQLIDLVNRVSQEVYAEGSSLSDYGVGRHVRHVVDHYLALQQSVNHGRVDYNLRQRDSVIETQPAEAVLHIETLVEWLSTLTNLSQPVVMVTEISTEETNIADMTSSLERELCYLINHTVHHLAYAALLAKAQGIVLDHSLGLAPSTASYIRQQAVQA